MTSESKQPRICLLTDSFHPVIGGGETHALLLCREWLKRGVPVFVMTRRITPDLPKEENLDGLTIRRLPPSGFRRFGKYLVTLPTYRELIRLNNEYDIIYVCSFRVAGIPAMLASRRLGKPCVLRAESRGELSGDFIWQSPDSKIRETPLKALVRFYLRKRNALLVKAAGFVSISRDIRDEYIKEGVPDSKIRLIFNGIETSRFNEALPELRQQRRTELSLPAQARIFAYSGKLNKGKGLEMLLRVWKNITAERSDCHLVLVGGGGGQFLSCEQTLRDFVRLSGLQDRVTFTGFQTDVQKYLQASDFFVFPSENESFGLALAEAMACGLPSLASRIGGIVDIVEDGRNGRMIEPRDERAWHDAMADFLAHPVETAALGQRGRATVMERFNISRVADEHLDMFRSLASNPEGAPS